VGLLLWIGVALGYALSVWFLWQQTHFVEPPDATAQVGPDAPGTRLPTERPQPSREQQRRGAAQYADESRQCRRAEAR
jgi:hypothetical protein